MRHTMRAAQIVKFDEPYKLRDIAVPECGDNDLLIEVRAAGFCHSDVQVLRGQFAANLPLIPSHEPSGRIVEIGAGVQGPWSIGDRVGVLNFKKACRSCIGCRKQMRKSPALSVDPRFCENREMAGFKHDGAFAQYMLADPETTVHLPEGISFEQGAPLMCAGATAWGALQKLRAELTPGDTVAVMGIGGVGHLAIQFAKALGYKTIAIDNRPEGCQLASEVLISLKPDMIINSSAENAEKLILDFTEGEGLAGVIVCMDSIDANAWCLQQLGNGGVLIPLGLPKDNWRFNSEAIIFRELTIRGSYVAGAKEVKEMLEVVAQHHIASHITLVDFEEVPELVEMFSRSTRKGRLVVQITSS